MKRWKTPSMTASRCVISLVLISDFLSLNIWGDAVDTQRRVQIGISPLFEEFVYLENLQWPDIVCDS